MFESFFLFLFFHNNKLILNNNNNKSVIDCDQCVSEWAMERYLRENFHVQPKRPPEEALRRWRSAVSVVKNPRRRFRNVANLAQRAEADRKRKKLQVLILWSN